MLFQFEMRLFAILLSGLLLWNSCSTEVDLLDDYRETTIVYCLLDQTLPKQYVRIQKAFLGPDNALVMAQQFDSINYINQLDVKIEAFNSAGALVNTFVLQPDTFTNKEPGTFAAPNQVIYSFDSPSGTLNTSHTYKLTVTNTQTGNVVTAETNLVEAFNVTSPSATATIINMSPSTVSPSFDVKWSAAPSARLYQAGLRVSYWEYRVNGDTVLNYTPEWALGTTETNNTSANSPQGIKFDKLSFYRFLGQNIPVDNNVISRKFRSVDFYVYGGDDVLKTYIELNGPNTSLAQDRPMYTNINNGLGVFSSRTAATRLNLGLVNNSIDDYLAVGEFTCQLLFQKTDGTTPGCQ